MYTEFLTHIYALIKATKRSLVILSIISISILSIFLVSLLIDILSVVYSSVYILLFLVLFLLFIACIKNLLYYQKIINEHETNHEETLKLLKLAVYEAENLTDHIILKQKSKRMIDAYYAYKKATEH